MTFGERKKNQATLVTKLNMVRIVVLPLDNSHKSLLWKAKYVSFSKTFFLGVI